MLFTSLSIAQVDDLCAMFAVLTPDGWVIPAWLDALRDAVFQRDNELTGDPDEHTND